MSANDRLVPYVLDTNAIEVFANYYPDQFPSFWDNVDDLIRADRLTSVRQVKQELEVRSDSDHIDEWVDRHEKLFPTPSEDEMEKAREILSVPHFQQLISKKDRLRPKPAADPWIIARAAAIDGCVVTEEAHKPHSAKIPNVCDHFGVDWCNVEDMLRQEGWRF